jgi:hypothetical protein
MCEIHPMAINIYMLHTLIIVLGKLLCIVMIRKISVFFFTLFIVSVFETTSPREKQLLVFQ